MTKRDVFRKFIAAFPGVDGEAVLARVDILQPGAMDQHVEDPERELAQLQSYHAHAKQMPLQQVKDEVIAMEGAWAAKN